MGRGRKEKRRMRRRTESVKCVRGSTERRKKSMISSKGGRLPAAHLGHRTSEGPELVGTRDAYKPDNGGPARGPPGPVLQVDNKGLPRRVRRRRSYRETKRVCKGAYERKTEEWTKEYWIPPSLSLWGDTAEKCPPAFLEIFFSLCRAIVMRRRITIGSRFDHNSMLNFTSS